MSKGCYCGFSATLPFEQCCEPLLLGKGRAEDPVALMRSRYCAFVTKNGRYLLKTWHPSTRPELNEICFNVNWHSLTIHAHGSNWVEFTAQGTLHGEKVYLYEKSSFVLEGNQWLYVKDCKIDVD